MKVPRNLQGRSLAEALCRNWQYRKVAQQGSHIIIEADTPFQHRIAIPDHSPLRIATLHSILRAVARHKDVSREQLIDSLSI